MNRVLVIGGGPGGLTAAYHLTRNGVPATVLEADPRYVGGLSRTIEHRGFFFDIGGHRFFSKSKTVEDLWTELLPDDLLERPRSSSIYYRGRFFSYPLKPFEALFRLGFVESARCATSYARARLKPIRNPRSFEDWVSNQFGRRLYEIFFKTYTEKVWGMPCSTISSDWAAQRIRGLSLKSAILHAFRRDRSGRGGGEVIKTLIDAYRYPRRGPGMMWDAAAAKVREGGGEVLLGHRVCRLESGDGAWTATCRTADGGKAVFRGEHVISTAPMRELMAMLHPDPSDEAAAAAGSLRYRDFLTVSLILRERNRFDENWIYIHDPDVLVGRVQNFKSWSPEMVPDPSLCCYALEYFCFEKDDLWSRSDEDLVDLATRELAQLKLASREDVLEGVVVRQPKAYPVYDDSYVENVDVIRREISERYPGLHLVGRNGMHKYNNQDHAMMTALLTVENILAGKPVYDPWRVNQDAEYHEAGQAGSEGEDEGIRLTPRRLSPD